MVIKKIISGGQTGADLAAFDAAIRVGMAYGGWVPKGRLNEAGVISLRYENLQETISERPEARTRYNVKDADATLIVSHGPLTGGSLYTEVCASDLGRQHLHVDLDLYTEDAAIQIVRSWLNVCDGYILNVAGPRASEDSQIYHVVFSLMSAILSEHTS